MNPPSRRPGLESIWEEGPPEGYHGFAPEGISSGPAGFPANETQAMLKEERERNLDELEDRIISDMALGGGVGPGPGGQTRGLAEGGIKKEHLVKFLPDTGWIVFKNVVDNKIEVGSPSYVDVVKKQVSGIRKSKDYKTLLGIADRDELDKTTARDFWKESNRYSTFVRLGGKGPRKGTEWLPREFREKTEKLTGRKYK